MKFFLKCTKKTAVLLLGLWLALACAACGNSPASSADLSSAAAPESTPSSPSSGPESSVPESSVPEEPLHALRLEPAAIHITGFEWGPAVDLFVAEPETPISLPEAGDLQVTAAGKSCTVENVFFCDRQGQPREDGPCLGLALKATPLSPSPFTYDMQTLHNDWAAAYPVSLTLRKGAVLTDGTQEWNAADCASEDMLPLRISETELFRKGSFTGSTLGEAPAETTLQTACYEPEALAADGVKNPLIIWLHGQGEGGDDVDIVLLGNEVVALAREDIQSQFTSENGASGAYVLAVQAPTMWMDMGQGQHQGAEDSMYREALKACIDAYLQENGDVDQDRVYIGGCSNGGYMTVNMLIHYPDCFAAAYPVCEAYLDSFITPEQLEVLSRKAIWFVQSADDTTVLPAQYGAATYQRLTEAGAQNCWYSMFQTVQGTDAPGTGYYGHFSWVYVFNNQVTAAQDPAAPAFTPTNEGGGTVQPQGFSSLFGWLNAQKRQ